MWLFNFTKSPQELLEDKYLELIDSHWVGTIERNPMPYQFLDKTYYRCTIKWVKVPILVSERCYEGYSYGKLEYRNTYSYEVEIGKVMTSWAYAEKVYKKIHSLYEAELEAHRAEQLRINEEAKEKAQQKKDKEFIKEYNKLCWATWEFNKQFWLLDEIEKLWKEQLELLKKWETNKNLIYKKREQFYSLTT